MAQVTKEEIELMIENLGSKLLVQLQSSTIDNLKSEANNNKSEARISKALLKWVQIIGVVTAAATFGAMFSTFFQHLIK